MQAGAANADAGSSYCDHLWRGFRHQHAEGGIARFEDGEFEYFDEENGIPGHSVYEIVEDQQNNLWLGTDGGIAYIKSDSLQGGLYLGKGFLKKIKTEHCFTESLHFSHKCILYFQAFPVMNIVHGISWL